MECREDQLKKFIKKGFKRLINDGTLTPDKASFITDRILPHIEYLEREIKKSILNYNRFVNEVESLKGNKEDSWSQWRTNLEKKAKDMAERSKGKWNGLEKKDQLKIAERTIARAKVDIFKYNYRGELSTWFFNILRKEKKEWSRSKDIAEKSGDVNHAVDKKKSSPDKWQPDDELKGLVCCYMEDLIREMKLSHEEGQKVLIGVLSHFKWIENVRDRCVNDGQEVISLEEKDEIEWMRWEKKWKKKIGDEKIGEICEKLLQSLRSFRFESSFDNWQWRIIKNAESWAPIIEDLPDNIVDRNPGPLVEIEKKECWKRAKSLVIEELKNIQVNRLTGEDGLSLLKDIFLSPNPDYHTIGRKYNKTEQALMNIVNRFRERLKGIKIGDVITKLDGKEIKETDDLIELIKTAIPISSEDKIVSAKVLRKNSKKKEWQKKTVITSIAGQENEDEKNNSNIIKNTLGIAAKNITKEIIEELELNNITGVIVEFADESFNFKNRLIEHFKKYKEAIPDEADSLIKQVLYRKTKSRRSPGEII